MTLKLSPFQVSFPGISMVVALHDVTERALDFAIQQRDLDDRMVLKVVLEGDIRRFIYSLSNGMFLVYNTT